MFCLRMNQCQCTPKPKRPTIVTHHSFVNIFAALCHESKNEKWLFLNAFFIFSHVYCLLPYFDSLSTGPALLCARAAALCGLRARARRGRAAARERLLGHQRRAADRAAERRGRRGGGGCRAGTTVFAVGRWRGAKHGGEFFPSMARFRYSQSKHSIDSRIRDLFTFVLEEDASRRHNVSQPLFLRLLINSGLHLPQPFDFLFHLRPLTYFFRPPRSGASPRAVWRRRTRPPMRRAPGGGDSPCTSPTRRKTAGSRRMARKWPAAVCCRSGRGAQERAGECVSED